MYSSDVDFLVSYSFNLCRTTQVDKLHIWKKKFFWKFFWGFLSIYYVVLAQIQKNQYVLKTSKSCLFGTINIYLIWRFVSILLQFSKKNTTTKIQKKIFFFQLLKITFSKHNSARFDEKKFLKISKKKIFLKIFFFKLAMCQIGWCDTN